MPNILVNNAGMNVVKPALDYTPDDYRQVLDTNLTAPFFLANEFARHHIAQGSAARIINIASVGGYNVLPGLTLLHLEIGHYYDDAWTGARVGTQRN